MLNQSETDLLFQFCSRHYVQFYDVQTELVDHLGSAIEARMAERPGLGFGQALEEVYLSFGPQGFAPIVRAKTEALKRRNRREIGEMAMGLLRWPLAPVMAAGLALEWSVWRYAGAGGVILCIGLLSVLGFGVLLTGILRGRRRQIRPLMANDFMHSQFSLGMLPYVQLLCLLAQVLNFYHMTVKLHVGPDAIWVVLLNVQALLMIFILTGMKRTRMDLQRAYPLAFA